MQRHLTIALLLLTNALAHGQVSYVVEPLKVSPLADDYAPVLVDSTLVFCSLRDRDNILDALLEIQLEGDGSFLAGQEG